jgi:hypothetical protein
MHVVLCHADDDNRWLTFVLDDPNTWREVASGLSLRNALPAAVKLITAPRITGEGHEIRENRFKPPLGDFTLTERTVSRIREQGLITTIMDLATVADVSVTAVMPEGSPDAEMWNWILRGVGAPPWSLGKESRLRVQAVLPTFLEGFEKDAIWRSYDDTRLRPPTRREHLIRLNWCARHLAPADFPPLPQPREGGHQIAVGV